MGDRSGVRRDFAGLEERRLEALRLVRQGLNLSGVAGRVRVARQTVSRWIGAFRRSGEAAVRSQNQMGSVG